MTSKDWLTWGAAAQVASPAWSALMVQVPAAMRVAVFPLIAHTPVVAEVKVTGSELVAVAVRVTGLPDSGVSGGSVNEIV